MNTHAHISIRQSLSPLLRAIRPETPMQNEKRRSQKEAETSLKDFFKKTVENGDLVHVKLQWPLLPLELSQATQGFSTATLIFSL